MRLESLCQFILAGQVGLLTMPIAPFLSYVECMRTVGVISVCLPRSPESLYIHSYNYHIDTENATFIFTFTRTFRVHRISQDRALSEQYILTFVSLLFE